MTSRLSPRWTKHQNLGSLALGVERFYKASLNLNPTVISTPFLCARRIRQFEDASMTSARKVLTMRGFAVSSSLRGNRTGRPAGGRSSA